MNDSVKKAAESFLDSPEGKKLASKRGELEKLASSKDGERVISMLNVDDVKRAAEKGDVAALSAAVQSVLSTEEGARLAKKLSDMMKG